MLFQSNLIEAFHGFIHSASPKFFSWPKSNGHPEDTMNERIKALIEQATEPPEFPAMTADERKAQAKNQAREKMRLVREERFRIKNECIGNIYVIGSECETYPYKIGLSKSSVEERVKGLQTSHWAKLKVFFDSGPIPHVETVERLLHDRYAKKRIRGEWFSLTKRDITTISKEIRIVVAEAEVKQGKKIARQKEQFRIKEENRRRFEENQWHHYLISKGLPPYIMEKNCSQYVSLIGKGNVKKVVESAVERSNLAYKKRWPRKHYMSYDFYHINAVDMHGL